MRKKNNLGESAAFSAKEDLDPKHNAFMHSRSCVHCLSEADLVYLCKHKRGGVAEWLKATVLKTVIVARLSWVRIPPPPHDKGEFINKEKDGIMISWDKNRGGEVA